MCKTENFKAVNEILHFPTFAGIAQKAKKGENGDFFIRSLENLCFHTFLLQKSLEPGSPHSAIGATTLLTIIYNDFENLPMFAEVFVSED